MSDALLQQLLDAGTPPLLVAKVAAELARAEERADRAREPSKGALRTRAYRERLAASQGVTCDAGDAAVTESVTPTPAPNKSPPDPQKLTPTPVCVLDAYTRGLAARLSVAVLIAGCQAAQPRPKLGWSPTMPPPAGVSAEQWAGFIAHRKAKRETLTPRAYDLLRKKLAKHADDEWPPGRIIDQIVERNWISFEPHWLPRETETRHGHRNGTHHDRRSTGLLGAVLDAERGERAQSGV